MNAITHAIGPLCLPACINASIYLPPTESIYHQTLSRACIIASWCRMFNPDPKKNCISRFKKDKGSSIWFTLGWAPHIVNLIVGTIYMGLLGALIFLATTSFCLLVLFLMELLARKKERILAAAAAAAALEGDSGGGVEEELHGEEESQMVVEMSGLPTQVAVATAVPTGMRHSLPMATAVQVENDKNCDAPVATAIVPVVL